MKTKTLVTTLLVIGLGALGLALTGCGGSPAGHAGSGHSHGAPAGSGWRLEFHNPSPLVAGQDGKLNLHLWDQDGALQGFENLAIAHEQKLHLLVVDETLSDYHHLHPVEEVRGKFVTEFTPRVGGKYLIFADVVEATTGTHRYVRGELAVAGPSASPDRQITRESVVDGYKFTLELPHGISTGGAHAVVRITSPDGTPVKQLEPVMGAFAHGVGFDENVTTVLHVHPHGEEPKNPAARGGPEIAFHLNPEHAGFHRFYVQVRIAGRDRFASFGLDVKP